MIVSLRAFDYARILTAVVAADRLARALGTTLSEMLRSSLAGMFVEVPGKSAELTEGTEHLTAG